MLTADDFKNFKSGDKIQIRLNPESKATQWVYFKSVFAEHLNYEDTNFQEHPIEPSELTPLHAP